MDESEKVGAIFEKVVLTSQVKDISKGTAIDVTPKNHS